MERINEKMKDEVCCFKSPGKIGHLQMYKLINSEDDEELNLKKVTNRIKKEIKNVPTLQKKYPTLPQEELLELHIPTLPDLLTLVSPKLSDTKLLSLISSMVTSKATSNFTMLLVAIGLLVQEKRLTQQLYEYRVTSSYDEVRKFKISAAAATTNKGSELNLNSKNGLIQGISDNFDAHLSTQNGLKQTHSLANIVTQFGNTGDGVSREPIERLRKEQLSTITLQDIEVKKYRGEKSIQCQRNVQLSQCSP